ncbi:hypothetical protein H3N56_02930 [Cetobacterium sp. 2A]|uniref:hypothetical protein n=1 Tax=Cetobacterium sp. 2A TaxID=2754723 RepID=UPI00163C670C|nr:hypothetical protein [Cetobacterium sp. 2A]MBC2855448.1 hypothetical protein [Cetobacterium sp. 2A]
MSKLSYSFDEENYYGDFDTIEELINEVLNDSNFTDRIEQGENYLLINIGENVPYCDCGSDIYEDMIEFFQEIAYKESDYAENYLSNIKPEHEENFKKKLDEIWNDFKKQINDEHPFYNVENCKDYRVYTNGKYEVLDDKNR